MTGKKFLSFQFVLSKHALFNAPRCTTWSHALKGSLTRNMLIHAVINSAVVFQWSYSKVLHASLLPNSSSLYAPASNIVLNHDLSLWWLCPLLSRLSQLSRVAPSLPSLVTCSRRRFILKRCNKIYQTTTMALLSFCRKCIEYTHTQNWYPEIHFGTI